MFGISSWSGLDYRFSGKNIKLETVFFALYPIKWYTVSVCPPTGDVNFDHLIRVVSTRFLHCTVSSVINKYYVRSYFETPR